LERIRLPALDVYAKGLLDQAVATAIAQFVADSALTYTPTVVDAFGQLMLKYNRFVTLSGGTVTQLPVYPALSKT